MAIKEPYEISVWEDVYSTAAYPTEKKIAIIGSNTMTAQCRAHEPKFVKNINGTVTFTFKMYYVCSDVAPQDITVNYKDEDNYINPFISLLSNERKIKVKWQNKWYDLIIKNCQEDSSGKTITYTCKDIFINELGKTGFNIELDTELANNNGTVEELATTILDGSDWRIYNQDIIQEKVKESGYVDALQYIDDNEWTVVPDDDNITLITPSASKPIFLFYSQFPDISDATSGTIDFFQFLFADGSFQTEENENLIINAKSYHILNVKWEINDDDDEIIYKTNDNVELFRMSKTPSISIYRGERLVRQQVQEIDPNLNRSVYLYHHTTYGDVYGYSATDYSKNSDVIMSLVVNGTEGTISDTSGWYSALGTATGDVESPLPTLCPPFYVDGGIDVANYVADGFLRLPKKVANVNTYVANTGLQENNVAVGDGFTQGEEFVFRYKLINQANTTVAKSDRVYLNDISKITPHFYAHDVGSYNNPMVETGDLFTWGTPTYSDGWITYVATCTRTISKNSLVISETYTESQITKQRQWDLYLQVNDANNYYYIGACEFFKLTYNDGEIVCPGEYGDYTKAYVVTKYYRKGIDPEDEKGEGYLYIAKPNEDGDPTTWAEVTPVYKMSNNKYTYESVRTISGKNSNRYNLLQQIAETFECWMEVQINHNDDGTIKYSTVEGVIYPEKYIRFVKDVGQYSGLSFTYGLDLKSISRTIASEQIATKTVVAKNSNEYGEDGYCAIGRSNENYPRVNYILNFDYYVEMGLLNSGILNQDLYSNDDSDSSPYIGLYYWLHKYNTEYDNLTNELLQLNATKDKQDAYLTTYQELLKAVQQSKSDVLTQLNELQYSIDGGKLTQEELDKDEKYQSLLHEKIRLTQLESNYSQLVSNIEDSLEAIEEQIGIDEDAQEELIEDINAKEQQFYSKYSGYIQEGSWSSEDYYDDTLYYLDAVDVAYTSSRPQVSYTISVIRLSGIEDFQNRKFYLGDICYVQDNEFFGKTKGEAYKEQVFISEVTYNFDNPAQDTFKVQNYKTQFEDLFQRITATTQSLQYSTGSYKKAASIVNEDGTIDAETLQASIASNNKLVSSYLNESVSINNQGILISDTTNINHLVKITSGGIFCSIDGGQNWTNAIRGDGISVGLLSSGVINTNKIIISDGSNEAFRWDNHGINAYYKYTYNNEQRIDLGKFVRFDGYGLYGLTDADSAYTPTSESDVWNTAQFGLTWRGFFLKNKIDNNLIEISTDNDFVISQNSIQRIKIGRLGANHYGITINNATGSPVLTTNQDGQLWLKNALNIGGTSAGSSSVQIGYLNKKSLYQCTAGDAYDNSIKYCILANETYIIVEKITDIQYNQDPSNYYKLDDNILEYDYTLTYGLSSDTTEDNRKMYYYLSNNQYVEETGTWDSSKTYYVKIYKQNRQVFNSLNNFIVWDSGNAYINNGTFVGQITATSGTIGGFIIDADKISSTNENIVLNADGELTASNLTATGGTIGGFSLSSQTINSDTQYKEITLTEADFNKNKTSYYYYIPGAINPTQCTDASVFDSTLQYYIATSLILNSNGNITGNDVNFISGQLGGFSFNNHRIYGPGLEIISEDTSIIKVQNIELGNGAIVTDYIAFTNTTEGGTTYSAYLKNPSKNNGIFIQSQNLTIDTNGKLTLGTITLNGTQSEESIKGTNWTITPEKAIFNNVDVAGTLHTSILAKDNIFSSGSTMIFKRAWKSYDNETIVTYDSETDETTQEYYYYLEDLDLTGRTPDLKANDFVLISYSGENLKTKIISTGTINSKDYIKVTSAIPSTYSHQITTITFLANSSGTIVSNNGVITINSTDSTTLYGMAQPLSLSITTPSYNDLDSASMISTVPNVVLGKLDNLNIDGIDLSGYGLYCDNVYLKGKLVTYNTNSHMSAGIDSNATITFNKDDSDNSRIVFWAGADSTQEKGIQNAYFQVTESGYLYAQKGKFEGSIVSNSIISNSDIYTNKLIGKVKQGNELTNTPLYLGNISNGIYFSDENNSTFTDYLSITLKDKTVKLGYNYTENSSKQLKSIININTTTNAVTLSADNLNINTLAVPTLQEVSTITGNSYQFSFGDNGIALKHLEESDYNQFGLIDFSNFTFNNNLVLGTTDDNYCQLQYKKVDYGYDLYVQ